MTSVLDTAKPPPSGHARTVRFDSDADRPEPAPVNNKSARIRLALSSQPAGMNYDELAKATGIDRLKIGAFVAAMIGTGDVTPYIIDGQRIFKYSGDPKRAGSRVADPVAPALPKPKPATTPASLVSAPQERALGESAEAAGPSVAKSEDRPPYVAPKRPPVTTLAELEAMTLDNVLAAAAHLAAVVRDQVEDWEGCEGIAHAVKGYELAERIYGATRGKT